MAQSSHEVADLVAFNPHAYAFVDEGVAAARTDALTKEVRHVRTMLKPE